MLVPGVLFAELLHYRERLLLENCSMHTLEVMMVEVRPAVMAMALLIQVMIGHIWKMSVAGAVRKTSLTVLSLTASHILGAFRYSEV